MKLVDVLQLVTGIAVIGGLVAVVWELNQSHTTAKTQIISDNYAVLSERWSSLMGENPSDIIAKACDEPESLTSADIQVLNAFFHRLLVLPLRQRHISIESDFYTGEDWQRRGTSAFYSILSIPYGRYWWRNIREWYTSVNPEISELGNNVMENIGEERYTCNDYPIGYAEWIQSELH